MTRVKLWPSGWRRERWLGLWSSAEVSTSSFSVSQRYPGVLESEFERAVGKHSRSASQQGLLGHHCQRDAHLLPRCSVSSPRPSTAVWTGLPCLPLLGGRIGYRAGRASLLLSPPLSR